MKTQTSVLTDVTEIIRTVLDGYDAASAPITRETSFQHDLALESIDIVVLGTRLTERYGAGIDFPGFLSGLDINQIVDLRVGDLVDYVTARLDVTAHLDRT